jgi:hypothetical protein
MKKTLLVALVVIVVLTGLPVLMGMGGMPWCTDCGPGLPGSAPCLPALLAGAVLVLAAALRWRVRHMSWSLPYWLLTDPFERPPQLV